MLTRMIGSVRSDGGEDDAAPRDSYLNKFLQKSQRERSHPTCKPIEYNSRDNSIHLGGGFEKTAQFLSLETTAQRLAYPWNLNIYTEVVLSHPPWDYLPFKKLGYNLTCQHAVGLLGQMLG